MTYENAKQYEKEDEEFMDCMRKNISPCCKAKIDDSHVILDGRYKNHGPRYCSKCGTLVFIV
jgi:hypothetical protein